MTLMWARNQRLNRSFLISLAIHLGIAMLFPAMLVLNTGTTSVETISFAKLIRMNIATPQPVVNRPVAVAPLKAAVARITNAKTATHASRAHQRAASKANVSSQAPTIGSVAKTGIPVQAATAPAAAPAAAPVAVAPTQAAGGNYGFGVEQPVPVLNQAVLAQLKALSFHATLVVTVDADGHTKNVVFKTPVDADMEARIRALLATATWDAATCGGGIGCEADATITL